MFIKLNKSCNSEIIKSLLDSIDLENPSNINLISDICNYIISNFMTNLIPTLKNLLTNKELEKNIFIKKELTNAINILEKVTNNAIIPVNKQKTKVSSKSIKNHKFEDDDDGGKFIQDSDLMNDDLIEDDNDLNFDVMNEMWTRKDCKKENDVVNKDKNNKNGNFLNSVINQKNSFKKNINNINKQKEVKKIKENSKKK